MGKTPLSIYTMKSDGKCFFQNLEQEKKWAFPKDCFLISGYKIYVAWSISFIFPVYPETQRKTDDSVYPNV